MYYFPTLFTHAGKLVTSRPNIIFFSVERIYYAIGMVHFMSLYGLFTESGMGGSRTTQFYR